MKPLFGTLPLIILVIVAGVAGCIHPSDANNSTVTVTTVPVSAKPTMLSVSATPPYPIMTLDPGKEVIFNIDRDPASRMITVSFKGGPGQAFISDASVWVSPLRYKGNEYYTIKTVKFPNKDQISINDTVEIQGAEGGDRVEVFVTSNGVLYKIFERTFGG
jgi:hypothetical protein